MRFHAKINVKHHKSHVMLIGKLRAKWSLIYFTQDVPRKERHGNVQYGPLHETCSIHGSFNETSVKHAGTSYNNFESIEYVVNSI